MILVFGTSGLGIEVSFFSGEAPVIDETTATCMNSRTSALGVYMSRYIKFWGSMFGLR